MRGWPAWVALVLGALVAVSGLVVMVVLGPDSRFTTGPHAVDTDDVAVVTAPGVISYRGLQVDVLVEVPANKPVFVGLGNTVDVQDYVGRTQRLEVTSFRVPWTPRSREVDGEAALPGAPTALDWWVAESAGLGGAAISTTLPDESVSLAVLAVGASDLSGLEVSFAYGVKGGFGLGLGALLGGSGLVLAGVLARRSALVPWDEDDEELPDVLVEEVEEEVYVFVDERGVEHEISAEEAARLSAALEDAPAEIVPEEGEPEPSEPEESVPQDPAPPEPSAAPEPRAVVTAPVVYVFVDEDGVEHEVSEDELAEYEVVDDEPDDPTGERP